MEQLDTVVVGGGIAGLCAADALTAAGVPVVLLERNPVSLGGRIAAYPSTSFEYQGQSHTFPVEHGIHGWWRQYRNFLSLIERHGLTDRLIDAYDQTIVFDDGEAVYCTNVGRETQVTPVPEPIHHAQLLLKKNIRRLMKLRELPRVVTMGVRVLGSIAFDPTLAEHKQRYDPLPVSEFTRGIPFFFQSFLKSLSRSGFFSDPQYVSLWAFLLALQLYVFLRKEDQCFSFVRGPIMPTLFGPIMAAIRARGGRLAKGIVIERVERAAAGGWVLHWQRCESPELGDPSPDGLSSASAVHPSFAAAAGRIRARRLVLAVDVEGAKQLGAASPVLEPVWGDLSVFRGRRATTIRMWWATAPSHELGESGVFGGRATADNYFWLHRFQPEFAQWHTQTGGAVSECHIYAPESLHQLGDDELLGRIERDMTRAFPVLAGRCVHRVIVRNQATHINFPVGCARRFPTVATTYPDLALCGDWIDGGAPVLYMERACQTGLAAANVLLRHAGKPTVPLLDLRPPPPHMQLVQRLLRTLDRRFPQAWLIRSRRGSSRPSTGPGTGDAGGGRG